MADYPEGTGLFIALALAVPLWLLSALVWMWAS